MAEIYSSSEVCFENNYCLPLEPDLTDIMAQSDNYGLRTYIWQVESFYTENGK